MALKENVAFNSGASFENAYLKIENVGGGKKGAIIEYNYYLSKEACAEGKESLNKTPLNIQFIPDCTDSAPNFIKQGYEHLKTLPEHSEAIDC